MPPSFLTNTTTTTKTANSGPSDPFNPINGAKTTKYLVFTSVYRDILDSSIQPGLFVRTKGSDIPGENQSEQLAAAVKEATNDETPTGTLSKSTGDESSTKDCQQPQQQQKKKHATGQNDDECVQFRVDPQSQLQVILGPSDINVATMEGYLDPNSLYPFIEYCMGYPLYVGPLALTREELFLDWMRRIREEARFRSFVSL